MVDGFGAARVKSVFDIVGSISLVNFLGFLILFFLKRNGILNNLLFELLILSTFVTGVILLSAWKFRDKLVLSIEPRLIVSSLLIFFLVAQGTLLNIDRSRSLYVLSWAHYDKLAYIDGRLDLERVTSFEAEIPDAIAQRVDEHIARGLITNQEGKISLTARGEIYFEIADALAEAYRLDGWKRNKY